MSEFELGPLLARKPAAPPQPLSHLLLEDRRPKSKRDRVLGGGFSVIAHLAVLALMFMALPKTPEMVETAPMTASLVPGPVENPDPIPAGAPPAPVTVTPPPKPTKIRPTPAPKIKPTLVADKEEEEEEPEEPIPVVTEAQLAGAATAGSGTGVGSGAGAGGGGGCDMVRHLQTKLRDDHLVQAIAGEAHRATAGRAIMVWNGDWVRSHTQDGKGLAAVREALMWEIAFAPDACKTQPVNGLVMISLADHSGSVRLVLGGGAWRWSDLVNTRRGGGRAGAAFR